MNPNATPTRTTAFASAPNFASVHEVTMTSIDTTTAHTPTAHHRRGQTNTRNGRGQEEQRRHEPQRTERDGDGLRQLWEGRPSQRPWRSPGSGSDRGRRAARRRRSPCGCSRAGRGAARTTMHSGAMNVPTSCAGRVRLKALLPAPRRTRARSCERVTDVTPRATFRRSTGRIANIQQAPTNPGARVRSCRSAQQLESGRAA